MHIGQIEENVQTVAANISRDTFIYDLLVAYGLPKASITRLQQGGYNLSKSVGEILWKKKLYFRAVYDEDLHGFIDTRRKDTNLLKHSPRFFVVTDFTTLLAYDSKTDDTLDVALPDLPRHFAEAGDRNIQASARPQFSKVLAYIRNYAVAVFWHRTR